MGRLAKLLSFVRVERNGAKLSDVKVDPGGGPNVTAEHFAPIGEDAHPLPGDYVVTSDVRGTGREAAVGYVDPKNESKAQPGDKRIYARDESGAVVVEIWLKNTGEATIINDSATFTVSPSGSIKGDNGNGSFELAAGGDFLVNGVTIDTSGNITGPATVSSSAVEALSVKAAGKELAGHLHPAGSPPGNTGPNI